MIKTTIFGGILFLIPFGILMLVLSELMGLADLLVQPIASLFAEDDYLGISIATVLAVLLILLVCFIAGFATRYAIITGVSSKTEKFLSGVIPGYWMLRARLSSMVSNEEHENARQIVTLNVGGLNRYGILMEDYGEDIDAVVFLPSAPNAESGIICRVPRSDLTFEAISAEKIHKAFEFYGRGLGDTDKEQTQTSNN